MSDSLIETEDAPLGVTEADASTAQPAEAPTASAIALQTRLRVEEGMRRAADGGALPQKRFFRQRAHINPLSFTQSYLLCVVSGGHARGNVRART